MTVLDFTARGIISPNDFFRLLPILVVPHPRLLEEAKSRSPFWFEEDAKHKCEGNQMSGYVHVLTRTIRNIWWHCVHSHRPIRIFLMVCGYGNWFQCASTTTLKQSSTMFKSFIQSCPHWSFPTFFTTPAHHTCFSSLLVFDSPCLLLFLRLHWFSTWLIHVAPRSRPPDVRHQRSSLDLCRRLGPFRSLQIHRQVCWWQRACWCLSERGHSGTGRQASVSCFSSSQSTCLFYSLRW